MTFLEEWDLKFIQNDTGIKYTCGYCNTVVSPPYKLVAYTVTYPHTEISRIFICTSCNKPTYISNLEQMPPIKQGINVDFLPQEISDIYDEARACTVVGAYTATSLICRKILMNVAVSKGAETNKSFQFYVNYLDDNHYIPPDGKPWVEAIRKQGNEAAHEIQSISKEDALEILDFTGILLKFIYEMPGRMRERATARE